MNDKHYKIGELVYGIERNNSVLLCNTANGLTQEIPREVFRVMNEYLPDCTVDEICEAAQDDDRDYFRQLFQCLIEKEYLCEIGKSYIRNLDFVVTNRCNLKCRHCCSDAFDAAGEDFLTLENIKNLINAAEKMKLRSIVITGGEPMIRKDFMEITDYLRTHFSGHCILMTNGLLIHENNVDQLIDCYAGFNISLDGYDEESCSKLRGKGVFGKVIAAIELLKNHGVDSGHIAVSMVETSYTYGKTDRFLALNKEMGTKPMLRSFSPIGRGAQTADEFSVDHEGNGRNLTPDEILELIKQKEAAKQSAPDEQVNNQLMCRSCAAGEQSFVVNYDGTLYPCILLDNESYALGNITDIPRLDEFLVSGAYKQTEGYRHFKGLMPRYHEKCSSCKYSPFCITCYASFSRYADDKDFDVICQVKQSEFCDLWR